MMPAMAANVMQVDTASLETNVGEVGPGKGQSAKMTCSEELRRNLVATTTTTSTTQSQLAATKNSDL